MGTIVQSAPRTILVLQAQRLGALDELEDTCRRIREFCGECRIVMIASASTGQFVDHLGSAYQVLRISRWTLPRVRALVRRLQRRGISDTCLVYDSAASPGPARMELLALLTRRPLLWLELGGPVRRISRARLWARFGAGVFLAGLAAAGGAAAMLIVGLALIVAASWVRIRRQARVRRQRISAWNEEWRRRL
jgi:hypothetical protein